jgi:hypothetical protein
VLFVVVTAMPNSLELLSRYRPALDFQRPESDARDPHRAGRAVGRLELLDIVRSRLGPPLVAALAVAGVLGLHRVRAFLYWQF